MTSFEDQLREHLRDATREVPIDPELLERAERRARTKRIRSRVVDGTVAVAALAALVAVPALMREAPTRSGVVVAHPGLDTTTPVQRAAIGEHETLLNGPAAGDADGAAPATPPLTDVLVEGWEPLAAAPLTARTAHTATMIDGRRMLVWGGTTWDADHSDGAVYDARADRWSRVADAPIVGRSHHTAVWTGERVVVVGGMGLVNGTAVPYGDAAAYDPATDEWTAFGRMPVAARFRPSVTWTGSEIVVWGGYTKSVDEDGVATYASRSDGAALDPATGRWRALAPSPLAGRWNHGAVWNGRRLIVFGGGELNGQQDGELAFNRYLHDAAVYDPETDTWTPIESPPHSGPIEAYGWTGTHVVYWDGSDGWWVKDLEAQASGYVWDPVTGEATPFEAPAFAGHRHQMGVTVGDGRLFAFGGLNDHGDVTVKADGAVFDPATRTWTRIASPLLGPRWGASAVWDGQRLLVWGGYTQTGDGELHLTADGGAYDASRTP